MRGPKSTDTFHDGARASGNSSTETTRPALMSTAKKPAAPTSSFNGSFSGAYGNASGSSECWVMERLYGATLVVVPELPEVESVRRQLDPELSGRRAVAVWTDPHPAIPREFQDVDLLEGRTIESVGRRGKFLIAPLDGGLELVMHLGMTGSFRFDVQDDYARAGVDLDDGRRLVFRDVRRFGRMAVVPAGDYRALPTLAQLGPEPQIGRAHV